MKLRYKFAVPINLILFMVLATSLIWELQRQEATGFALLRARLDEEARFVHAAHRVFGASPQFGTFLREFCHASDTATSPEHQVALLDSNGKVLATAAEHARRPMDPEHLGRAGDGFRPITSDGEPLLVRVLSEAGGRVVIAESTRDVESRVAANLKIQAVWFLGAAVLVFGVRELEGGRLGAQVPTPNGDELGALARKFNAMSRTLADKAEADRREMATAERVQSEFLPSERVRLGGFEFTGRCIQAGPVGGDVYDVRLLPDGRVGFLVADLSGHNVAAALHTAMVRAIVWREAADAACPGEVLSRLNDQLAENLPEEHFATVFFGWLDLRHARLHYANAGHPPALLRDASGGLRELGPTMPLLGILPALPPSSESLGLGPEFRLLVFSDGLTEVFDRGGHLWGTRELGPLLETDAESVTLVSGVLERAAEFRSGLPQQDDITIVLVKFESPPSTGRAEGRHRERWHSSGSSAK